MINFFRKIRQQLLEENKIRKYFTYAIGEIVLVVIGILIALQINNWNENKKNRAFEKELLEQISVNLTKDKENLIVIKNNFEKAMGSSVKITESSGTVMQRDSLKYWLGYVIQFDRFQPLTNAYEVAKSKGLDLITNKELRFLLGDYYDDQAKQVSEAIEDSEVSFNNDWIPYLRNNVKEMKFKSYVIMKNEDQFFKESLETSILKMNYDNFSGGANRIATVLKKIDTIISIIEQELALER